VLEDEKVCVYQLIPKYYEGNSYSAKETLIHALMIWP
jgi:hypothetical protein